MSDLDEFRQQYTGRPGPPCGLASRVLQELPTEEADKLLRALDAPWEGPGKIGHTQISEWLRDKHGIHYSPPSVGRHRRAVHGAPGARCSCDR